MTPNALHSTFEQLFTPAFQEHRSVIPKKMDIRNLIAPSTQENKFDTKERATPSRSSSFTPISTLRYLPGSLRSYAASSSTISDDHSTWSSTPFPSSSSSPSSFDPFRSKKTNLDDLPVSRELMDIAEVLEGLRKGSQQSASISESSPSVSTSYEVLPCTKSIEWNNSSTPSDGGLSRSISSETLRFSNRSFELKPKKRRRRREEIERKFLCPIKSCDKSYGSEGALKTHIKIKHKNILRNHQDAKTLIDNFNNSSAASSQEVQPLPSSPTSPIGSSASDDLSSEDEENRNFSNNRFPSYQIMDTSG